MQLSSSSSVLHTPIGPVAFGCSVLNNLLPPRYYTNPLLCYINPHAISTERGHKGPPPYSVDTGTCACSPSFKGLPAGGEVPAPSHRVMLSTISARHLRLELPSNLSAWTRPRVTRSFALPTYGEVSHRAILPMISARHLRFIYRPIEAAATFFATPANINKRG